MTTALILTAIATTFTTGFLLGDRRGVRQCNAILDENWRELMKAIRDEPLPSPNLDGEEARPAAPTVH
ncbi:hypothetical protein [Mesorhizobium sp. WSM2239]|uniref:Uncharacterized protein n=2 Tax=unclassified Mesorhizobium TaxID=325217 RepID=A0AAU8DH21_9HYPH